MPVAMTPGTYIRLRRKAAGRSLEEMALLTVTNPHVPAHRRAQWWADIEAGGQPVTVDVALALAFAAQGGDIRFDPTILAILVAVADGQQLDVPAICAGCGCSYHDYCNRHVDRGCSWHSLNWCTACEARRAAVFAAEPVVMGIDLARGPDLSAGVAA